MVQNVRISINNELEQSLDILRQATLGTLNTTELIKYAIGKAAAMEKNERNKKALVFSSEREYIAHEMNKDVTEKDLDNIAMKP